MKKEIILIFCLILYCSSTTEDTMLLKQFNYGSDNSFEFLDGYRTYYLQGNLQSYKEVEFKISSAKKLTQIKFHKCDNKVPSFFGKKIVSLYFHTNSNI